MSTLGQTILDHLAQVAAQRDERGVFIKQNTQIVRRENGRARFQREPAERRERERQRGGASDECHIRTTHHTNSPGRERYFVLIASAVQ